MAGTGKSTGDVAQKGRLGAAKERTEMARQVIDKALKDGIQHMRDEDHLPMDVKRVNQENVLVIMTGGIGDTVIGIPCLSVLKEYAPRLNISVLADPINEEILKGRPEISDFFVFPRLRNRNAVNMARLIRKLRQKRFGVVIGLMPSNLKSHSLIALLGGSRRSIKHFHRYPEHSWNWQSCFSDLVQIDERRHFLLANLDLLQPLGIDVLGISEADLQRRMRIVLSAQERDQARDQLPKSSTGAGRIGFHPGCRAGWEFKQWDRRKYAELADRLIHELGTEVIWFGGKEEAGTVESIRAGMKNESTTTAGKLSLRDTAALIGTCDLFVSNDSGLMHVATAMDVTTIGLYSSTHPRNSPVRTGPFGSQHKVVQAPDIQQVRVEDVYAEVVNSLMNRKSPT